MTHIEDIATASPARPPDAVAVGSRPASRRGRPGVLRRDSLEAAADRRDARHLPPAGEVRDRDRNRAHDRTSVEAGFTPQRSSRVRNQPVGAAIAERYRRGEASAEELLLELYHAGISLRQVEEVVRAIWRVEVSLATVSELNVQIAERIDAWRCRPLTGRHAYVHLGAIDLRRSWGGETIRAGVLAATGVNEEGCREVLGVVDGSEGGVASWRRFLADLKNRGLTGVRLVVSGQDTEAGAAVRELYPRAACQSCVWQFQRRVRALVPFAQLASVDEWLRAIHLANDRASAEARARQVVAKLHRLGLPEAAVAVEQAVGATLSFYAFPRAHWRVLRTSFPLLRVLREVRERTRIVGAFSNSASAVHLVCARLRRAAGRRQGRRHEVDMGVSG